MKKAAARMCRFTISGARHFLDRLEHQRMSLQDLAACMNVAKPVIERWVIKRQLMSRSRLEHLCRAGRFLLASTDWEEVENG